MNHSYLLQNIKEKYIINSIKEADMNLVKNLLNRNTVIELLKDVLSKPELLKKICDRSYTHALGFDKIVLVDLSKDIPDCKQKTQVRLHIWEPMNGNALPIVESLHEHSFDFISTILSGHLENQQFSMSGLTLEDENLLDKIKHLLSKLTKSEINAINEQVEIIEALLLKKMGSNQFDSLKMSDSINIEKFKAVTGLNEDEIFRLCRLQGHYVSNRVSGEKKAYKHVLKDYVALSAHNVMLLNKGDYYFHPYQLPHRLYYDNKILNSTILITTPVHNNPEGGSLQRPTYVQKEEQAYDKISLDYTTFETKIRNYINFLELTR